MDNIINLYNYRIYHLYNNLITNNIELNNYNLSKIFEYYSCIQLTHQLNKPFYLYDDVEPEYKNQNNMSIIDTGIDAMDKINSIVQCKLRQKTLTFREISTFLSNITTYDDEQKRIVVKWENLYLTYNDGINLSPNLFHYEKLFNKCIYKKDDLLDYCNNLLEIKPELENNLSSVELRYYQKEAIQIINENENKNVIINIPTGGGKNLIMISTFKKDQKYLILVPRRILTQQFKEELIKFLPDFENDILIIGDGNNNFDENKNIVICVYNSVNIIEPYIKKFNRIFIDEAHHIKNPHLYQEEEIDENDSIILSDSEDEEESVNNEDELKKVNYLNIIKSFSKYNNNIYLSATIDKSKDFIYYTKDIRELIDADYLCDYDIRIPIFNKLDNQKICEYLIQHYHNIIVYCNSRKEGETINEILNSISNNCSEFIDCDTSKKERKRILNDFSENRINFVVNVNILTEGTNLPNTNGVVFLNLCPNQTKTIQIIGRALRKHSSKTLAHIIYPSSNMNEIQSINKFLKIIINNDKKLKNLKKKLNGYININNGETNEIENENLENIQLQYEYIYNSLGENTNKMEVWKEKLQKICNFIEKYKRLPNETYTNIEEKKMRKFIGYNNSYYKNFTNIMIYDKYRNIWEKFNREYEEYLIDIDRFKHWEKIYNQLKNYIDINKRLPSSIDENKDIKFLGIWLVTQKQVYKNKINIMKNKNIYDKWTIFMNNYYEYLISDDEIWYKKLEQVKEYIDKNNKLPSKLLKEDNIKKLGYWIINQKTNFKNKKCIMKNKEIYNEWIKFNDEYKEYFTTNIELWYNNLEKIKKYINENNKLPSSKSKDNNIKILGAWIDNQKQNYENKIKIMKNEEIYNEWIIFINEYSKYFLNNNEIWENNLEKIKKYINENNKLPSSKSKDNDIKFLSRWVEHQKFSYKNKINIMKDESIYKKWSNFKNEYHIYLFTDEEKWYYKFNQLKIFIDNNKNLSYINGNDDKKLTSWLYRQNDNYRKKIYIMKNKIIYNEWHNFINEYNWYFRNLK